MTPPYEMGCPVNNNLPYKKAKPLRVQRLGVFIIVQRP